MELQQVPRMEKPMVLKIKNVVVFFVLWLSMDFNVHQYYCASY